MKKLYIKFLDYALTKFIGIPFLYAVVLDFKLHLESTLPRDE